VVHPDFALMFRALDEVPPLLEGSDDHQHLLVVDLIVPFDGDRDLERKATGCHFSSSEDTWERTTPVAKSELLASMWKGLVRLGEMRTRAEVTLPFNQVNAVRSASSQCQLELFRVKLKSGQACSEKSWMNHR